jgi:uncharacterized protein (TIGR03382 family)
MTRKTMRRPLHELLTADHARLEAPLLATKDPPRFDHETFEAFRAGLLRHISIERRVLLLLAGALALAVTRDARADAIPPPPDSCPRGQVAAPPSHSMNGCVLEAPSDCGPGWHGALEGKCQLALCDVGNEGCSANEQCVKRNLCVVEDVRDWGWGRSSAPSLRGPELAEPPHQLDVPEHHFHAVDVCGPGATCTTGRCEALRVCLPRGETRVVSAAKAGHPVEQAFVRKVSERALAWGRGRGDSPIDDEGEIPGSAPRHGGCAGCGTSTSGGSVSAIAALAALVVLLARRTRS